MTRFPPYTELLTIKNIISEEELEKAKSHAKSTGKELEVVLIEDKFMFKEQLLKLKSEFYGCSFVDLKTIKIDTNAVTMLPRSMCERYRVICLKSGNGSIDGVMYNPNDRFAREYVRMRTGFEFEPRVGYWGDMKNLIDVVFSLPHFQTGESAAEGENVSQGLKLVPHILPPQIEGPGLFASWKKKEKNLKEAIKSVKNEWEILSIISNLTRDLSTYLDKRALIPRILEMALHIFNVEGVSLILLRDDAPYLYFKDVLGTSASQVENIKIPLDEKSIAGWIVINREPVIINDVKSDQRHSRRVDEVTKFSTRSILGAPVIFGKDVLGVLEAVNKKDGDFTKKELDYMIILASDAAIALKNAEIFDKLNNFSLQAVELLVDLLECVDHDFKGHMVEVARIATSMGEELRLAGDEQEKLCYSALLHDIGMIRGDDWEEHPLRSAEILHHIKLFEGLLPYVLYHHEKYDGTGFPFQLKGDRIPQGAQILAIAESFTEGRKGRHAKSEDKYVKAFLKGFGSQFNPALKEAFEKVVAKESAGARV